MARNFSPRGRLQKREQQDLSLFSGVKSLESKYHVTVMPGQHGAKRVKLSDYGKQLRAKQMIKRIYGVLERQFRNYFSQAFQAKGSTGENLLKFLECRLDNVVYRMGYAKTRKEARQLVGHKAITVNGDVVNIPSYVVAPGDVIAVADKAKKQLRIQESVELAKQRAEVEWVDVNSDKLEGTFKAVPERDQLPAELSEQLVVELYSK
jgi:small subunit ribosomal protein S4